MLFSYCKKSVYFNISHSERCCWQNEYICKEHRVTEGVGSTATATMFSPPRRKFKAASIVHDPMNTTRLTSKYMGSNELHKTYLLEVWIGFSCNPICLSYSADPFFLFFFFGGKTNLLEVQYLIGRFTIQSKERREGRKTHSKFWRKYCNFNGERNSFSPERVRESYLSLFLTQSCHSIPHLQCLKTS